MKTALIFPGQGSQKVGMGADVYQAYPQARRVFDEADEVLGFSLSRLCFEGPEQELTDTLNAQPAILTTSMAFYAVVRDHLTAVDCMAGHSLGEYSAFAASGALSLPDAVRLTRRRGEWMKAAGEQTSGGMAAILNLDEDVLESVCRRASEETGGIVQVANYNSPGQIVISGALTALNRACELSKEQGARRAIPLAVTVSSHSPLMEYAAKGMKESVGQTTILAPGVPVISNVSAEPLSSVEGVRHEMIAQLTSPVRWTASVREMLGRGVDRFVEIGPGNVLAGLVRRIEKDAQVVNISDAASLKAFLGD